MIDEIVKVNLGRVFAASVRASIKEHMNWTYQLLLVNYSLKKISNELFLILELIAFPVIDTPSSESSSCPFEPFGSSRTAPPGICNPQCFIPSPTACPLQLGVQPRHHPWNCGETLPKVHENLLHTKTDRDYGLCWKRLYTPRPLQFSWSSGFRFLSTTNRETTQQ